MSSKRSQKGKNEKDTTESIATIAEPVNDDDEKESLTPNKDSSLASKLREFGLDEERWENHFNEVGMKTGEQLQHINTQTFNILSKKVEYPWENDALQKVLLKYNQDEYFTKQTSDFKEMCKKLPDPTAQLKETFDKDRQGIKDAFKEKQWMTDIDKKSEMKRTEREPSGDQIVNRKSLKSCDIVRKIAAGQLLRGQFIHENLQTSSTYRQQLIDVDDNIEIMSPGINETMETLEIFDREQAESFDSVLKQSGKSFATTLHFGIKKVAYLDVQASIDHSNSNQTNSMNDKQISFVSLNQILVVPTASFNLSNQSVYLSKCASDALKCLHGGFKRGDSSFENQCMLFFSEFGSHFYTGVCHFGGRYKWTVTSETNSIRDGSQNYEAAKTALNGSIGGGYLWFEGEVKGAYEKNKEKVTETRSFSETCKVTKKLEKFGGPQEVDDIKLWKKGLTEYNNTWVIIDKDVSQKCYEGVWKLVQGKENEFSNADKFSKGIESAWENLYRGAKGDAMAWSLPQVFLDWKSEGKRFGYSVEENLSKPDFLEKKQGQNSDERSTDVRTNIDELQSMRSGRIASMAFQSELPYASLKSKRKSILGPEPKMIFDSKEGKSYKY